MEKIVLVGDSWGVGEWIADPDGPEAIKPGHPGMTEYLSSDYNIVNLSKGRASNWQICYTLTNYLKFGKWLDKPPTIFILQSDAARDWVSEKFNVDHNLVMSNSSNLLEYYKSLIEIWYMKLNLFAEVHKVKIHMIGGLSSLDLETLSLYNNLIPCCESWTKLIDKEHIPSQIPLIFMGSVLLEQAKKNNRFDLVDEIISISDQNFPLAQKMLESDYFGPVYGDYHPSRKGHKVMADYIKNYLEQMK